MLSSDSSRPNTPRPAVLLHWKLRIGTLDRAPFFHISPWLKPQEDEMMWKVRPTGVHFRVPDLRPTTEMWPVFLLRTFCLLNDLSQPEHFYSKADGKWSKTKPRITPHVSNFRQSIREDYKSLGRLRRYKKEGRHQGTRCEKKKSMSSQVCVVCMYIYIYIYIYIWKIGNRLVLQT